MSVQSANLFIERMTTDLDFAGAVTYCKNAIARKAFVKAAGYDFSAAEVKETGRDVVFMESALYRCELAMNGSVECDAVLSSMQQA